VGRTGALEQRDPGVGELRVDAAPVVAAEDALQQPAILEAVDQPRGRAARQRGRAGQLLHPHMPAVLARERVQHRVLDDGEVMLGLEGALERRLDHRVQTGQRAPALRPDLHCVVCDAHAGLPLSVVRVRRHSRR
jgi:hypothetical protein